MRRDNQNNDKEILDRDLTTDNVSCETPSESSTTYISFRCPAPYSFKPNNSYDEARIKKVNNNENIDIEENICNENNDQSEFLNDTPGQAPRKIHFKYFSNGKKYQKLTAQSPEISNPRDIELVTLQSSSSSSLHRHTPSPPNNATVVTYQEQEQSSNENLSQDIPNFSTHQQFLGIRRLYVLPKLWVRWKCSSSSAPQETTVEQPETTTNESQTASHNHSSTRAISHLENACNSPDDVLCASVHVIPIGRRTTTPDDVRFESSNTAATASANDSETFWSRFRSRFSDTRQRATSSFHHVQTRLLESRENVMRRFEQATNFTPNENEALGDASDDPTHQQLIFFGGILIAPYFFALGAFLLFLTPREHKRTRAWGMMNLIACIFLSLFTLLSSTVNQRPPLLESITTFFSFEHIYPTSIDPFNSGSLRSGLLWIRNDEKIPWTTVKNASWPYLINEWTFLTKSHSFDDFEFEERKVTDGFSNQTSLVITRKPQSTKNILILQSINFRIIGTALFNVNGLQWSSRNLTKTSENLSVNNEETIEAAQEQHVIFDENETTQFFKERLKIPNDFCGIGLKCTVPLSSVNQWAFQACNVENGKKVNVVQRLGFRLNHEKITDSESINPSLLLNWSWLCELAIFFNNKTESIYLKSIQLRALP